MTKKILTLALALAAGGCSAYTDPEPAPTATPSARPPARPTVDRPGPSRSYAMDQLFLGGVDRTGHASSRAWQAFGFDLDGRATTKTEGASCRAEVRKDDGKGGVDNMFGAEIVSIMRSLDPTLETKTNADLASGAWTWILVIDDVGGDDDAKAPGHLYLGAGHAGAPTFGVSDHWPAMEVAAFPEGYVAGGTWVSGTPRAMELPLRIVRQPVLLSLQEAIVTLRLADGDGVVAGALPDAALRKQYLELMHGALSCLKGPAMEPIFVSHVDFARDLRLGSGDAAAPCDAVSFGVGFHAAPTGALVPSAAPLTLPAGVHGWCSDPFGGDKKAPGAGISPL